MCMCGNSPIHPEPQPFTKDPEFRSRLQVMDIDEAMFRACEFELFVVLVLL